MKFFVSYSRSLKSEVWEVIRLLKAAGHEVWWDGDIPVVEDWWATILKHIEWCEVFVFMISEKSVQSEYCLEELRYSIAREIPVLPFKMDNQPYIIPSELGRRQWFIHDGDAARMLAQIMQDCRQLKLKAQANDAPRPPEPGTGSHSLIRQFHQAVSLAESGHFAEAEKRFRNIASIDTDTWGEECQQWITQVRLYAQIVELADHKSTLKRALQRWADYLQLPGDEFDPFNLQQKLTSEPQTATPIIKRLSRSKVYDILPSPFEWVDIPPAAITINNKRAFLLPFAIAKYPVTNAQFAKFLEAGGYSEQEWWTPEGWEARVDGLIWDRQSRSYKPTGESWTKPRYWSGLSREKVDYPVIGVSWYEAEAFCMWLRATTGESISLPSGRQWQWAAQGDDGRIYSWGNQWDSNWCNNSVAPFESKSRTHVTRYESYSSPFGAVDLTGNVWEWCSIDDNEHSKIKSKLKILKGGSWKQSSIHQFSSINNEKKNPCLRSNSRGFRFIGYLINF